jgi:hypothetical protein
MDEAIVISKDEYVNTSMLDLPTTNLRICNGYDFKKNLEFMGKNQIT